MDTIQEYQATYAVVMEGGNSFPFIVDIDVVLPACSSPFSETSVITSPQSLVIDSSQKMIMTGYTWTKPIALCGAISAVLSSVTSSSGSISLTYDSANSRYQVEPADHATAQTHSFYLTLSGTDLASASGVLRTEILGPYVLKVVCGAEV